MRYCITGGLGVIGSLIARSLERSPADVAYVIDDGRTARHRANGEAGVFKHPYPYTLGLEPDCFMSDLFLRTDRVLHAAASTGIPYSAEAPMDDWLRNVDGTLDVLDALAKRPLPTVILSSVKPYDLSRITALECADHYKLSGNAVDELTQLSPDEPYAASKAAQSLIAQAYARSYDLPLVVFRCSNLYGPACPHGPRHGWLTWLCIQSALGWPIEIQGTGKQTRDMLFWSDVESAALAAWEGLEAGTLEKGAIFNLGGGYRNTISVLQAVEALRKLGADITTRSAPGRKHEDMLFVTDTSRFHAATGWEPKVSVTDGIAQIYEWACANRDTLASVYAEYAPK